MARTRRRQARSSTTGRFVHRAGGRSSRRVAAKGRSSRVRGQARTARGWLRAGG